LAVTATVQTANDRVRSATAGVLERALNALRDDGDVQQMAAGGR